MHRPIGWRRLVLERAQKRHLAARSASLSRSSGFFLFLTNSSLRGMVPPSQPMTQALRESRVEASRVEAETHAKADHLMEGEGTSPTVRLRQQQQPAIKGTRDEGLSRVATCRSHLCRGD